LHGKQAEKEKQKSNKNFYCSKKRSGKENIMPTIANGKITIDTENNNGGISFTYLPE